jgi:hypothetical protein
MLFISRQTTFEMIIVTVVAVVLSGTKGPRLKAFELGGEDVTVVLGSSVGADITEVSLLGISISKFSVSTDSGLYSLRL